MPAILSHGRIVPQHLLSDHSKLEWLIRAHTSAKPNSHSKFAIIYFHRHSPVVPTWFPFGVYEQHQPQNFIDSSHNRSRNPTRCHESRWRTFCV